MIIIIYCGFSIGLLFLLALLFSAGSEAVDAYTTTQMMLHAPAEEDLLKSEYKKGAAMAAARNLEAVERERWEQKGVMFRPHYSDEVDTGLLATIVFLIRAPKSDIASYYGHKMTDSYITTDKFLQDNVSYKGDYTYRVQTTFNNKFAAYGEDGTYNPDSSKIPEVDDTYISTVKLAVEENGLGKITLHWNVVDTEFVKSNFKDESIEHNLGILKIPGSAKEQKQQEVAKRIKAEPQF